MYFSGINCVNLTPFLTVRAFTSLSDDALSISIFYSLPKELSYFKKSTSFELFSAILATWTSNYLFISYWVVNSVLPPREKAFVMPPVNMVVPLLADNGSPVSPMLPSAFLSLFRFSRSNFSLVLSYYSLTNASGLTPTKLGILLMFKFLLNLFTTIPRSP